MKRIWIDWKKSGYRVSETCYNRLNDVAHLLDELVVAENIEEYELSSDAPGHECVIVEDKDKLLAYISEMLEGGFQISVKKK